MKRLDMKKIFNFSKFKGSKKKAQSLIEYALILAMVAVIAIAALQVLGAKMGETLTKASTTVGQGGVEVQKAACKAIYGDNYKYNEQTGVCTGDVNNTQGSGTGNSNNP